MAESESSSGNAGVNDQVRRLYDELGDLLEEGDDALVEEGPGLLQEALEDPGFLEGVTTERAEEEYTRAKVIGDDDHVIRFMEWPPEYALLPHEHHGRPCFEVLVDGQLAITDMDASPVPGEDDLYELEVLDAYVAGPGDAAVVDPRVTDIHTVYSPVRSRSLHVYPDDKFYSIGYVHADSDEDYYRRKEFRLDD